MQNNITPEQRARLDRAKEQIQQEMFPDISIFDSKIWDHIIIRYADLLMREQQSPSGLAWKAFKRIDPPDASIDMYLREIGKPETIQFRKATFSGKLAGIMFPSGSTNLEWMYADAIPTPKTEEG